MVCMSNIARIMRGGQKIALSFVVAAMVGCSGEVSVDQDFVDLFIELRVVETTYGATSPMARMVRQKVLRDHGYTIEKFISKTDKILEDEKMWVPFQKAVTVRVDSLMAELNNAKKSVAPSVPHTANTDGSQKRGGGDD